jgi:hypothetical protein
VGSAGSWLPPELGGIIQPYSMGPLLRWDARIMRAMAVPPMGTLRKMDIPEISIRATFMAPSRIQYQARDESGVERIIYFTPKGLVEALQRSGLKR